MRALPQSGVYTSLVTGGSYVIYGPRGYCLVSRIRYRTERMAAAACRRALKRLNEVRPNG
jgi:hypothetical protein